MSAGTQPSRALLIAAGSLTQLIGALCFILGLASIPVVHDLKGGMSGVIASVIASLAAIVCGTLVWRGRLVPLALAAGLDVGFGIGLPRGGSAVGAMLRMLPADEASTAETLVMVAAVTMFLAAILCVLSVPSALKLRAWARQEIASGNTGAFPAAPVSGPYDAASFGPPVYQTSGVDETAPTKERPQLRRSGPGPAMPMPLPPPPETRSGNTLRGLVAQKLMPTQVLDVGPPRKGGKPAIIIGVAITLIAIGIIVITAASGSKPDEVSANKSGSGEEVTSVISGSATTPTISPPPKNGPAVDGGAAAVVVTELDAGAAPTVIPSLDDFITRFHDALGKAAAAELAPLFDVKAFAFGVEANDLAEGRGEVVTQLREDLPGPGPINVRFAHHGQDGDSAWLAEELRVGSKTCVITAALALRGGAWVIAALHWGEAMPNATAYKLAREGNLAVPDVIPNTNDGSELAKAMQTAFASKPSFVEARSGRADAFNFGSASGERLKGGDAIKRIFSRINAVMHLHDAVKVGVLGERGGWGVANVDFTDSDRDGTEVTQTFRVLAVWIKEDAGWRIVQTQFSNAR